MADTRADLVTLCQLQREQNSLLAELLKIMRGEIEGHDLTVPQAARMLNVSRATMYRMIECGEVRPLEGRHPIRVTRAEIARYRGGL